VIAPEHDARIKVMLEYARANVLPADKLARMAKEQNPDQAVGKNEMTRIEFPIGYRVVYNQEEQPVHGVCHHISISVDETPTPKPPDKVLPNEIAVNMIMQAFGIKTTVRDALFIYVEDLDYGGGGAINVIEPVERKNHGPRAEKEADGNSGQL
jgi:hypothetical protein